MEYEPNRISKITVSIVAAFLFWSSFAGAYETNPEAAFVKKTISSHKNVIFSKSYCP
ncbi:hypothetical protein Ddye_021634, partial [Dipteronia dyeriana]